MSLFLWKIYLTAIELQLLIKSSSSKASRSKIESAKIPLARISYPSKRKLFERDDQEMNSSMRSLRMSRFAPSDQTRPVDSMNINKE
jgi:hypothetical protein